MKSYRPMDEATKSQLQEKLKGLESEYQRDALRMSIASDLDRTYSEMADELDRYLYSPNPNDPPPPPLKPLPFSLRFFRWLEWQRERLALWIAPWLRYEHDE